MIGGLIFAAEAREELSPGWPDRTDTSPPWTRWWWPGSAVDEAGLTAELEAMAEAGIGGVEITPIYGARGAEDRYVEYLSPRWVELLKHTGREAHRLGMRVDMATGTGWPFGGPWVEPENASQRLVWRDGDLGGRLTNMDVKRAAPGGEGLVLDPFSAESINRYLERFDEAFEDLPNELLRGQFHDSYEYYGASWTSVLPERFESMHGYDVNDFGEALTGTSDELPEDTLARVKHDFRKTLDVLHQEYLQAWADWSRSRGWTIRNQSHGAPANLLDLYALADIPETEVFGSTPFPIPGLRRERDAIRVNLDVPEPLVSRMASSGAHVAGRNLVSCETATWLRDHWKVTLAYVKPEVDRIFLDGINHVFYHGTVYSPEDAEWPGWLFYASTQFNRRNPWWEDFSALNAYVGRVQSILQGGSHGNDVLLYWPIHELWHNPSGLEQQLTVHRVGFILDSPTGETAIRLRDAGYAFDYVSDKQIATLQASDGKLRAPGGDYSALVVPPLELLPVETLENLLTLARGGAVVIFSEWPTDVPGWGRLEERRDHFHTLLNDLPDADPVPGAASLAGISWDQGVLYQGDPVEALARSSAVAELMIDSGLECIRRLTDQGMDYFIANLTARGFDGWIPLGLAPESALLLDPLTGKGGVASLRRNNEDAVEMRLQLDPGESIVVRGLNEGSVSGPEWPYLSQSDTPIALETHWEITFIAGGPVLPEPIETESLESWTDLGGEDAVRFSGTARYAATVILDDREAADEWVLDLGDVRDSARVYVNGEYVQTLWSIPFRARIGSHLQPGENKLVIEVTNVAANRIRDMDRRGVDWKIMHEINFVDINYRPFDASDWTIQPAGLLGPVQLFPMAGRGE